MKAMNLVIAQPIIPSYRHTLFSEVAKQFDTTICSTNITEGEGYKQAQIPGATLIPGRTIVLPFGFVYQTNILSTIIKNRPDALFITANLRNLSFWSSLVLSKLLGINVYSHGQGLYNQREPNIWFKIAYIALFGLTHKYVCYTDSVKSSLANLNLINSNKITVLKNTIINDYPIENAQKHRKRTRVIFIGRLRDDCNLDIVLDALSDINRNSCQIVIDIVGGGELLSHYQNKFIKYSWAKFHGEIYEDYNISEIAKRCTIGVYGGNAGLSVVHYMSLSLAPIVHSNLYNHKGPEPSYIIDGYNGYLFDQDNPADLAKIIRELNNNPDDVQRAGLNAYQTYVKLNNPSMHEKLIETLRSSARSA